MTFAGTVAKHAIPGALAGSDCCIATLQPIPMFKMTYPNKVFDYMAAARPTVLAIDGVIREVIQTSGGGVFVPPGDPVALADAVRDLARRPERASQMGRAAREFVVQHFDRRLQAEKFESLMCRLSSDAGGGRGVS